MSMWYQPSGIESQDQRPLWIVDKVWDVTAKLRQGWDPIGVGGTQKRTIRVSEQANKQSIEAYVEI